MGRERGEGGDQIAPPPVPECLTESSTPSSVQPPPFDPTRMIGIIKRKALIKDLAALYHTECLTCCQQLLEIQKKQDEPYIEIKTPSNLRNETMRPSKRVKKLR